MMYLQLFWEFLNIGIFSFGGGYATLPFLYHISDVYGWYSHSELANMLAVSSVTPGPVGINVATYAGFKSAGILGSVIATGAIMLPAFVLVILVSKLLNKFSENIYVKGVIELLKPISCAMLASVGVSLVVSNVNNLAAAILLVVLMLISLRIKLDPIFYLGVSAVIGIFIF